MDFSQASFATSVFSLANLPESELPEIAFAGRSNVGKSSLINCLLNRKSLVKTSGRPGKTRSLNFFLIADSFFLVDLPGYGYAQVPKKMQQRWRALVEGYLAGRRQLIYTFLLVDIRHAAKPLDTDLAGWLACRSIPFLVVYTKGDKLSANQRQRQVAILDKAFSGLAAHRLVFSSKTGEGRDDLRQFIADQLAGT